jgi:hypothetical protein
MKKLTTKLKSLEGMMLRNSTAASFLPVDLFTTSAATGVWYDPSDTTTLFQDSAGTTPVTASGQPVGLMLDKSKGLVRGPELVTNGTFDAGLSGWTVSGGAVASVVSDAGSNVLSLSAAGGSSNLNWPIPIAAGKTIELTYSRRGVAAGGGLLGKIQVEYTDFSADTHPIANVVVSGAYEAVTWVLTLPKTASKIRLLATTASADTVGTTYFDNISIRELPGHHATQPTAASRPIFRDVGGLRYLECDGVDDGMATGNIDFTGTDKVSIFAGVRKLSDAGQSAVIDLSATPGLTPATFTIQAPGPSGVKYRFASIGGSNPNGFADTPNTAYNAPHAAVITGVGDITADSQLVRVNGVDAGTNNNDQGTGNYGNHPLYLFRRGGTTLPFNGWFYGLAITGRLTTDAETVATERFLAAKSAVVIP